MKKLGWLFLVLQLTGCATANLAKNVSTLTFDEKANSENMHSIGNIEGRDCTWYVWGHAIGEDPNVRNAFQSAVNQTNQSLIPGQAAAVKGAPLKAVKNVSVEQGGFSAWVASRRCIVVTGVGLQ